MSLGLKNTYCVLGDQCETTIVFWATMYCVMADRLLCIGRPVKSQVFNIYKACKATLSDANHIYNLYITTWAVDNLDEVEL